jgi:hypothetical protein
MTKLRGLQRAALIPVAFCQLTEVVFAARIGVRENDGMHDDLAA